MFLQACTLVCSNIPEEGADGDTVGIAIYGSESTTRTMKIPSGGGCCPRPGCRRQGLPPGERV